MAGCFDFVTFSIVPLSVLPAENSELAPSMHHTPPATRASHFRGFHFRLPCHAPSIAIISAGEFSTQGPYKGMTKPDADTFRRALSHFATGVTVVTAIHGPADPHGMTANAFASVSLDPLLVLVCIGRTARTHALLGEHKRFCVNVLARHQEAWARHFALPQQDPVVTEQLGIRFALTRQGTPMLPDTLAQLDCQLVNAIEAGDHTIFLGEVEQIEVGAGEPLIFYRGRYRSLPKINS
jgi:flavin reductase (DIM6/NTAB) family NADH-FMN oxidoreductase RutF